MYELINELMKQDQSQSKYRLRMLKSVKAGKYNLSIQGSPFHYCYPKFTLPPDRYIKMELAIFNKKGSMVSINRSKILRRFKWYDELLKQADCLNSKATVYACVPVSILNDLYLFLKEQ